MRNEELITFWLKSAHLDRKTVDDLFTSRNYVGALFFVHLYLEKTLKGLVQKTTGTSPPFTHDLLVLAKLGGLQLANDTEAHLATMNTFNIRARYADHKFAFYKKATKVFAGRYRKIGEELYQWFLSQF